MEDKCKNFHGPHHGEIIDDLYHDCDVHHDHEGKDSHCPYYFPMVPRKGYDYPTTEEIMRGGQIRAKGFDNPIA